MSGREQLAAAAEALNARHGRLLAGDPSVRPTEGDRLWDALDGAQARLEANRRDAAQLTLDVRPR